MKSCSYLAALALLVLAPTASAEQIEAQSAAAFRDSVGVNTHITYYGTAYGDWGRIVAKLDELGIDHLRDGVYGNPAWGPWNERYYRAVELAAAHGKRFTFGMGHPTFGAGTLDELAEVVATRLRHATEALESPNEYDVFGGPSWLPLLRDYVGALHARAKGDPRLADLPIVGPSFGRSASRAAVGDLSGAIDQGNLHSYTGGNAPSQAHLAGERTLARLVSGDKPLVATEAGFHNALNATSGQAPTPEDIAAAYTLRTLLEHFRGGVQRTFLYELIDEMPDPALGNPEQHFGLLRNDYSEKPAATALKNLLGAIGRPAAAGSAKPLDVAFDGETAGLQRLLLADPDGAYKLVLWLDRSLWDRNNHKRFAVSDQTVGVTLPATTASLVRPAASGDPAPLTVTADRAVVQVGADPVVLAFRAEPRSRVYHLDTETVPRAALTSGLPVLVRTEWCRRTKGTLTAHVGLDRAAGFHAARQRQGDGPERLQAPDHDPRRRQGREGREQDARAPAAPPPERGHDDARARPLMLAVRPEIR